MDFRSDTGADLWHNQWFRLHGNVARLVLRCKEVFCRERRSSGVHDGCGGDSVGAGQESST